ncbi:hypothetical protein [Paraburkholderia azotifigens]|jgi:hypothetical protein|uniref:hypothetical protein n=1 Tax=Paraburkholderia azotifigens TaxID=2057004 RepID=UPI0038B75605
MNIRKILSVVGAMWWLSVACASSQEITVSLVPALQQHSAGLDAALRALRAGIQKDAKECASNASGMGAVAIYHADIRKTIETATLVALEVTGNSQCDGVHPSVYQYGIAYSIKDGKRLDLNAIYAVGRREDGSLFLTDTSVGSVMKEYTRVNAGRPQCLDPSAFNNDYFMSKAFTMSIWPDGSLELYFDVPYVEAACLPPIRLNADVVAHFKDEKKASMYGLP